MEQVKDYFARKLHRAGLSNKDVARAAGFPNHNIISMFKSGATRIPLSKVPALADAIDVPREELMRRCLLEYDPHLLTALTECFAGMSMDRDEVLMARVMRVLVRHKVTA